MRFFLITFNLKGIASLGNISFTNDAFPSKTLITKMVSEQRNNWNESIVVVNIFEFQDEEDYNKFNS